MRKQSLIENKNVYVAIPKRLFDDDIVSRGLRYIHSLRPLSIDDPRGMFASNEEWARAFPDYLKIYNTVVVITDNDGMIGKGVYEEVRYFDRHKLPCFIYVESGEYRAMLPVTGLHIVDHNNWIDYARIEY